MILLQNLLVTVPLVAFLIARRRWPQHTALVTGALFGSIVSPLSLGMYSLFFLHPIGLPLGLIGGASVMFHGSPGFHFITALGLRNPREVVTGIQSIQIEIANGILWAIIYGMIGFLIDKLRASKRARNSAKGSMPA